MSLSQSIPLFVSSLDTQIHSQQQAVPFIATFFPLLLFLHFLTVLKVQWANVHVVQTKARDLALAVRLSEWTGNESQG